MLDQLMQLIQQSSQQAVIENNEIPAERNNEVLNEAHDSIANGLKELQASGQLNTLLESAGNNPSALQSNPAIQNISNQFIGSITEKFGLNKGTAATIAASIIPVVLSKIAGKGGAGGNTGGLDLGGLLSSLTGGNTNAQQGNSGIRDTINSIGTKLGLDKDGDGDVDLNDLSKLIR